MVKKLKHNQRLAKVIGLPKKNGIYQVPDEQHLASSSLASHVIGKEIAIDATLIRAWCKPPATCRSPHSRVPVS